MLLPCLGQIPISSFLVGGGGVGGVCVCVCVCVWRGGGIDNSTFFYPFLCLDIEGHREVHL